MVVDTNNTTSTQTIVENTVNLLSNHSLLKVAWHIVPLVVIILNNYVQLREETHKSVSTLNNPNGGEKRCGGGGIATDEVLVVASQCWIYRSANFCTIVVFAYAMFQM
ncbi:hypothetical protein HN873_036738 [Arachis hypogaea]